MLNALIRFSIKNRLLIVLASVLVSLYGMYTLSRLPVDVFPDLNRPTVTIMIEAPGLSPEEVETQVTFPVETVINGSPGVDRVRSSSGIGLSVIWAEFGWETDIWKNRQIVQERLNQIKEKLPPEVEPILAPISSIMGEIMLIGLHSDTLPPMEVRSQADWIIRPQLLSVAGIAQVTVMGGGVKQYQIMADPERMRRLGVTFQELEESIQESNENSGGGFVTQQSQVFLVRNLGRVRSIAEIEASLVKTENGQPIRIRDVATVQLGMGTKFGDGSVNGKPAVIMAIQKQPGSDTRILTVEIDRVLKELKPNLPEALHVESNLFRQSHFIQSSIQNVEEALRDGAFLVMIVIFLFLMNFRTTFITLTAIPLSLMATALVFNFFGLSINTMTLGGIAVAIGELVDDAIVDVENIYRRLRENRHLTNPRSTFQVVFDASSEIRSSIILGTGVVILVFIPLFALSGIEGRLFAPLGVAYIVSILASLLISLTVTPALSFYLLPGMKQMNEEKDGRVLAACKKIALRFYQWTLPHPYRTTGIALTLVTLGLIAVATMGTEFLPPFNEGTATISVFATPDVSLEESNRLGTLAENMILEIPEVKSTGRRTGRAEQDEHAEGVNSSEIDVDFWTRAESKNPNQHQTSEGRKPPLSLRSHDEVIADIRGSLDELPGVLVNVGQPISHRIDHLLSGVRSQVAVKVSGPDLDVLRKTARQVEAAMKGLPGVVDLQVEQQVLVPQLRLRVKRDAATRYGFRSGDLIETMEAVMKGKVISQVIEGQSFFDLVLWTSQRLRDDSKTIGDLRMVSPSGAVVLLSDVMDIVETVGPNQINRENVARRIVVSCNVQGRDLGSTVKDIQESIAMDVLPILPKQYSISYGGQFESQQSATRLLLILTSLSMIAMFGILYAHFKSGWLAAQVMLNIPFAFIGSVTALLIARESFSVASLVGFISLTGIASRNGILMISHYIHLMTEEGMHFGRDLVIRGSQERVAPVLMTALTTFLGLVPLLLAKGEPGKEILYPVAVVVFGGLLTSTLLDFAVTPTIFLNFSGKSAAHVAESILKSKTENNTGSAAVSDSPRQPAVNSERPSEPGQSPENNPIS